MVVVYADTDNCIPPCLLWQVIIAELLDFDSWDYDEWGDSLGPGQISPEMVKLYKLGPATKAQLKDIETNIRITAEKLDKQLVELCIAAAKTLGTTPVPAVPKGLECPALSSVPATNPKYPGSAFMPDPPTTCKVTANCDRAKRCKKGNQMAAFDFISCTPADPDLAQRLLTATLITMNDIQPNPSATGDDKLPFYARTAKTKFQKQALWMFGLMASGQIGCANDGALTINGKPVWTPPTTTAPGGQNQ